MGWFLVLVFYPESLCAGVFRAWMRSHKRRCPSCPPDVHLYCSRYAWFWRRIVLSRRALARAAAIA
jgi:hypothetical protein